MFERLFGNRGKTRNLYLDIIEGFIKSNGNKVHRDKNGLYFKTILWKTSVSFVEKNVQTIDREEISDVIYIKTNLREEFYKLDEQKIAFLNAFAVFSAIIKDEDSGTFFAGSRLTTYKNDEKDIINLYAVLAGFSALLQVDSFHNSISCSLPEQDRQQHRNYKTLPKANLPSQWGEDDFEYVQSMLEMRGIFANADQKGLTAEFPWGSEGFSAIKDDKTSLFTLQSDMPHPILGNGLFLKLELPLSFDETKVAKISNRLNIAEMNAIDSVPFFGAWCGQINNSRLAFVGFYPNLMYKHGIALNIATWMLCRSQIAKEMLNRVTRDV